MTTPEDVVSAFESPLNATPRDFEDDEARLSQEINARRVQVENAELLHHLRSL